MMLSALRLLTKCIFFEKVDPSFDGSMAIACAVVCTAG